MNDLVIVDGYNFIFNYVKARSIDNDALAAYRDKLIEDLVNYKYSKNSDIVVVFDAKNSANSKRSCHIYNGIKIIYSQSSETADSVIEELVHKDRKHKKIFVVTSDYMQQKVVFKGNIYRKSSREFGIELNLSKKEINENIKKVNKNSNSFYFFGKRLKKDVLDEFSKIRKS